MCIVCFSKLTNPQAHGPQPVPREFGCPDRTHREGLTDDELGVDGDASDSDEERLYALEDALEEWWRVNRPAEYADWEGACNMWENVPNMYDAALKTCPCTGCNAERRATAQ
jgi:hypothetical protein